MTTPQIINPLTPLAYLPPDLAIQFEASRYLYVATLGAFLWDWLMSMPEEYRLITKANRAFPLFVYFFSRVAALAYIVTSVVFQVAPIPNCGALQLINTICYCLTVSSASYLFYLRVQAVFHQNRLVQVVFGLLWLMVAGGSVTVPLAVRGIHIEPTRYCVNAQVKSFSSIAVITSTVNDSLIFIAISLKLMSNNKVESSSMDKVRAFFRGEGLSSISKALFKGGQVYYLSTVGMNLLALIMVLTPSAPPVYRAMFTIPNNALQNVMACKVFRQLRLGILTNTNEPGTQQSGVTSVPLSWRPMRTPNATFERPPDSPSSPKFSSHLDAYNSSNLMNIRVTRDVTSDLELAGNRDKSMTKHVS